MTPEARQMLDQIDAFLVQHNDRLPARELWNVLTALRGPDIPARYTKKRTTVPIRAAAFPRLCALGLFDLAEIQITEYQRDPIDGATGSHFLSHVMAAANALNLLSQSKETGDGSA